MGCIHLSDEDCLCAASERNQIPLNFIAAHPIACKCMKKYNLCAIFNGLNALHGMHMRAVNNSEEIE